MPEPGFEARMQFIVGEEYVNHNGDEMRFVVVEIRNQGREGLLRSDDGGAVWFVRDEIMQTGKWRFERSPRFSVGRYFDSVSNPGDRALVADARHDGREGRLRFVNERGERFLDEGWFTVRDFLGSGEWRLPAHEA